MDDNFRDGIGAGIGLSGMIVFILLLIFGGSEYETICEYEGGTVHGDLCVVNGEIVEIEVP